LDYLVAKYRVENKVMKSCEPRDLLNRFLDDLHVSKLTAVFDAGLARSGVEQLFRYVARLMRIEDQE
jgi:hypothetical protein